MCSHVTSYIIVMECPGIVTPNSIVSPVRERYTVGQSVTVSCDTGHNLPDVSIDSVEGRKRV